MTRRIITLCTTGILVLAAMSVAHAGGPLSVFNGQPVKYRTAQPVVYHVDKGAMGAFSNAVARNLVITSFQEWENVATAVITFKLDSMSVDVNGTNYTTYLGTFGGGNYSDGLNPIIFDNDGSIIDGIIGEGASANVIGFAGSAYSTGGPNAGFFMEGHAVMNGLLAGTGVNQFSEAEFKSTFVHEFGHFIGLDHTQINAQFAGDGNTANDLYIPTMYPTSTDDDTQLGTLNPDDIAAVSSLYPVASYAVTTGTITGTLTRQDASVVRGAVVVAISTTDSLLTQISTVTDYLQQNAGSYAISGLAPGSYWIKVEPVRTAFTGGSSVGPYADDLTGLSFVNPVSVEYYNGTGESGDPAVDTATSRVPVVVAAGTPSAANIVANGEVAPGPTGILQNYGTASFVFELPSEFSDQKYAVRFTPGITAPLEKVAFLVNGAPNGIEGTGTLRVTVFSNKVGSIGGIPDVQINGAVTRPFSSLTAGVFNEVDLTPLAITVQQNVHFHVVFEIVGIAGDTLQFLGDDAASPTSRSSSFYNAGQGIQWYNFEDPDNYGTGYNLVMRAYLTVPSTVEERMSVLPPDGFALDHNFPNPFNPTTTIPFRLSESGTVTIDVMDLLGRRVAAVVDKKDYPAGEHHVSFNAHGLPSGTYIAVMSFGNHRRLLKMLLLR